MKVLVTGANGQLGYDVVKELQKQNIECYGAVRKDFDIVDFEATEKFITNYMPDAVIHCAAYTSVDKAEDEQGLCYLVNVSATENIAEICKKIAKALQKNHIKTEETACAQRGIMVFYSSSKEEVIRFSPADSSLHG